MNNPLHFFSALLLGTVLLTASCKEERKLPIYGVRDTKEVAKADGFTVDTIYQTIPDFKFLNQDSVMITNDQFKGKIYVADFFFTSCTSICPIMHKNMKALFQDFKSNPDVMFLSHTIDFKYDKPSVLKKYAQKLDVYDPKWQFVYGSKDSIYNIAEKSYLVAVQVDSNDREGYVHQGFLVLIDKDRRIRGAYDGTNPEQVEQLRKDIPVLLDEYKK
ncbi:SCO family protein [Pedobacter antarcticus]|uniref:SCO family protein n=1 Tax=Pedobacter antarcticus TaxID=34086 RepID=UPI001C57BB7C|nr:SCO family protein [Pedobacter antarcticus]